MADDKAKPSIPSWQRAAQQQRTTTDDGVRVEGTGTPPTTDGPEATKSGLPTPTVTGPVTTLAEEEAALDDAAAATTDASQLENMKSFLEDPTVQAASPEKKRAFFHSKGIPAHLIDQALQAESGAAFNAHDFESFKQSQGQAVQPLSPPPSAPKRDAQQTPTAPPIITYPEFLVEAHKPAPLITPGRIVNTAYIAGTLYALLYGASKLLVDPMSASLADARHDFAQHSQSKLDELNDRLTKLVTKLPELKREKSTLDADADTDVSSETSDPTELYHRDMGTQTSPPPSRRPSSAFSSLPAFELEKKTKDPLTQQTTTLSILQSHLQELLARAEGLEQPNKDRQESMNRLRTYVDTLMYASPGSYGMWNASAEEVAKEKKGKDEDVIEEVKKEIRGVKGVLLSAKRFPGVAGRVGG